MDTAKDTTSVACSLRSAQLRVLRQPLSKRPASRVIGLRLSVGIPSFNEGENLAKLIRDITSQHLPDSIKLVEIIVSDDSDNGTDALIQSRFQGDQRVRLLHHTRRRGVAAALNEIFRVALADVLVILAADTRLVESALWEICKPFEQDSRVGIASGESVPVVKELSPSSRASLFGFEVIGMLRRRHDPNLYVGRFSAFSNALYKSVVLPHTTVCEEPFMVARSVRLALRIEFVPSAKCRYLAPSTMRDLLLQNVRSSKGQKRFDLTGQEWAEWRGTDRKQLEHLANQKHRPSPGLAADLLRLIRAQPVNAVFWCAAKLEESALAVFYRPSAIWEISPTTKTGLDP